MLFNGNVFENVVPNYYHLKPQTWCVNENISDKSDVLYIVEKILKTLFNGDIFYLYKYANNYTSICT